MALREVSSKQLAAKPWSDVCLLPAPCPTPLASTQHSLLSTTQRRFAAKYLR
jgi:hypothetical protein